MILGCLFEKSTRFIVIVKKFTSYDNIFYMNILYFA